MIVHGTPPLSEHQEFMPPEFFRCDVNRCSPSYEGNSEPLTSVSVWGTALTCRVSILPYLTPKSANLWPRRIWNYGTFLQREMNFIRPIVPPYPLNICPVQAGVHKVLRQKWNYIVPRNPQPFSTNFDIVVFKNASYFFLPMILHLNK